MARRTRRCDLRIGFPGPAWGARGPIQGRVNRLDLPSYLALWQQARLDPRAPHFQAQLVAAEMVAAGRRDPEVTLVGERTDSGVELKIDSESLAGVAHWPVPGSVRPAELHLRV